jgi:hypothetical protein
MVAAWLAAVGRFISSGVGVASVRMASVVRRVTRRIGHGGRRRARFAML